MRVSRTVLRGTEGETPSVYSPDRAGSRTRRDHPEPDYNVQAARCGSIYLLDRCATADRSTPEQRDRQTDTLVVEIILRR